MSLPNSHVRCHGCDFHAVIERRPLTLRYVLPNGETVDGGRLSGWCSTCDGIRDVEAPLDADALGRQLDALSKSSRSPWQRIAKLMTRDGDAGQTASQAEQQRISGLLRLAEVRTSPPRCLTCGSTAVTFIRFNDPEASSTFVHSCGGRLYRVPPDPDGPRISYRPEVIRLDANGLRL